MTPSTRGLDRPWDQAANWLFAARAAISADDEERSVDAVDHVQHWLRTVDDPWLHVRRDAVLGELARIQHRFDDAVDHLGRAAETSRRLGFRQTEAYQLSSLGRAQCQAGDYHAGAGTLQRAIDKAEATGDVRLAALARVHLGRVLRALGQLSAARTALEAATAWHRTAEGGEQAALGTCLLAAMDAADRQPGAEERLVAILDDARRNDDAHVEVFALDALARIAAETGDIATARDLCQSADRRMRRRLPLHHRSRPNRRPLGQANRLNPSAHANRLSHADRTTTAALPAIRPASSRDIGPGNRMLGLGGPVSRQDEDRYRRRAGDEVGDPSINGRGVVMASVVWPREKVWVGSPGDRAGLDEAGAAAHRDRRRSPVEASIIRVWLTR